MIISKAELFELFFKNGIPSNSFLKRLFENTQTDIITKSDLQKFVSQRGSRDFSPDALIVLNEYYGLHSTTHWNLCSFNFNLKILNPIIVKLLKDEKESSKYFLANSLSNFNFLGSHLLFQFNFEIFVFIVPVGRKDLQKEIELDLEIIRKVKEDLGLFEHHVFFFNNSNVNQIKDQIEKTIFHLLYKRKKLKATDIATIEVFKKVFYNLIDL